MKYKEFPAMDDVECATHEDLCGWYRFLPNPPDADKRRVLGRIMQRMSELGGMTHEISKKLGADGAPAFIRREQWE